MRHWGLPVGEDAGVGEGRRQCGEGVAAVGVEDVVVGQGVPRGGQARERGAEQQGSTRERSLGRRCVQSEARWPGVDFVFYLFRLAVRAAQR